MDRPIEKKKWPLKRKLLFGSIGVIVITLIVLSVIQTSKRRTKVERAQLLIGDVISGKFREFIPIDGTVLPMNTTYIDAMQGGIVEKIYVEDGAMLMYGDTILKLQNPQMELSYMDQETRMYDAINNLQNSRVSFDQSRFLRQKDIVQISYQLDQAVRDFDRKVKLHSEKVISDKEFEDATREYNLTRKQLSISLELKKLDSLAAIEGKRQIETSITRIKSNLELLRRNLANMYVKAPSDGVLSSFEAEIGETKNAGERLGQIDVPGGYKIRANIDERYVAKVYKGQPAEFEYNGKTFSLSVRKIYTDVTNGTFQVDLIFDSITPLDVKRGQTLQLRLLFSSATDALMINRGGFFQQTGGNWIFVLNEDQTKAVKRVIRIGRQNTMQYEVLEGLKVNEKVIISSYESFGNSDELILE